MRCCVWRTLPPSPPPSQPSVQPSGCRCSGFAGGFGPRCAWCCAELRTSTGCRSGCRSGRVPARACSRAGQPATLQPPRLPRGHPPLAPQRSRAPGGSPPAPARCRSAPPVPGRAPGRSQHSSLGAERTPRRCACSTGPPGTVSAHSHSRASPRHGHARAGESPGPCSGRGPVQGHGAGPLRLRHPRYQERRVRGGAQPPCELQGVHQRGGSGRAGYVLPLAPRPLQGQRETAPWPAWPTPCRGGGRGGAGRGAGQGAPVAHIARPVRGMSACSLWSRRLLRAAGGLTACTRLRSQLPGSAAVGRGPDLPATHLQSLLQRLRPRCHRREHATLHGTHGERPGAGASGALCPRGGGCGPADHGAHALRGRLLRLERPRADKPRRAECSGRCTGSLANAPPRLRFTPAPGPGPRGPHEVRLGLQHGAMRKGAVRGIGHAFSTRHHHTAAQASKFKWGHARGGARGPRCGCRPGGRGTVCIRHLTGRVPCASGAARHRPAPLSARCGDAGGRCSGALAPGALRIATRRWREHKRWGSAWWGGSARGQPR
mmetsp:Transcript_20548/g.55327  ORF Transcript_20548/g.55327 Transcript_20548/m.55327 type:complete len:546 (+) Transcript_20548:1079-2716(+)